MHTSASMSQIPVIELEQNADLCVVRIKGRIASGENDAFLSAKAREIKATGCRKLLVDLRELASTGSSGLGFLVDLYASVTRNNGGRTVLAGPTKFVRQALDITRLSTIIPVEADMDEAMAYLAAGDKSLASGL